MTFISYPTNVFFWTLSFYVMQAVLSPGCGLLLDPLPPKPIQTVIKM